MSKVHTHIGIVVTGEHLLPTIDHCLASLHLTYQEKYCEENVLLSSASLTMGGKKMGREK